MTDRCMRRKSVDGILCMEAHYPPVLDDSSLLLGLEDRPGPNSVDAILIDS